MAGALISLIVLAAPESEALQKLRVAYASLYEWKESGLKNVTLDVAFSKTWRTTEKEGTYYNGAGQIVVVDGKVVRRHYPKVPSQVRTEVDAQVSWVLRRFARQPFDEAFPDAEVVKRWASVSRCQLSTARSGAVSMVIHQPDDRARVVEYRTDATRIWREPSRSDLPCRSLPGRTR